MLLQADKADCSLIKKARKTTAAQHKRQTNTYRLYRAKRRVRHDAFPLWGKAERERPAPQNKRSGLWAITYRRERNALIAIVRAFKASQALGKAALNEQG